MPWTPLLLRTSLTSSSLNGLRTATINFIVDLLSSSCPGLGTAARGRRFGLWRRIGLGRRFGFSRTTLVQAGHGEGAVAASGEPLLGERLFAVDSEVADLEDVVLVAGTTENPADDLHQDEGDQRGPDDDED